MITRLTESQFRSYIRNRVISLLTEAGEATLVGDVNSGEQKGMSYSIDTFCSDKEMQGHSTYVIPRLTTHLMNLKSMCEKYNIDFEWNISRVEDPRPSKSGWKITANAAMPELKVAGYTFVGSVVPMTDDYALVVPSKEFKDNLEVLEKIKTTVSKEKCSGCNRVAERGIYYVFQEDATGELKKYGATCARKYLGISVESSIGKVFSLLYHAISSEQIYGEFDGEGFGRGGDWRPRGYNQVAAACAYFALFGIPEARFSFKYCKEYEQLEDYYSTIDDREIAYPTFYDEIVKNDIKIESYINSFYSGVSDFCKKMNVDPGSFDEAIKANGMYLGGLSVTKLAERRFRSGTFPYVALKFFQAKRDEGVEITAVEEFYGMRQFAVNILNKDMKRGLEGRTYLQVYAKTENNEYLAWYQNEDNDAIGINKQVLVYGEYGGENGKYCMLKNVKVMGEAEQQKQAERSAVVYPEDGTRLQSTTMTVIKSAAKYIVFKDQNNCEYFVSNTRKNRWGEVVGLIISEWAQIFKPGAEIRLTGTVDSYTDRYGETKHTLKRVIYDESSFPEIDWSQYSLEELIHDKKKLPVNGKYLDLFSSWSPIGNNLLAQLASGEYVVYDMTNQAIKYSSGDFDSCREFIRNEECLNMTWDEMQAGHKIVLYNNNDKCYEPETAHAISSVGNELDNYTQKGNAHLVFYKGGFVYYDPIKHCLLSEIIPVADFEKNNYEKVKEVYNSLPAPAAVQINEAEIRDMVIKSVKKIISV